MSRLDKNPELGLFVVFLVGVIVVGLMMDLVGHNQGFEEGYKQGLQDSYFAVARDQ